MNLSVILLHARNVGISASEIVDYWTHMEPIEPEGLGHDLMTEWGKMMRDDGEGRASWSVKPRLDPEYHGDPPNRIRLVDKIVARHRVDNQNYWSVVSRYYLSDLAFWQIAKGMKWSELQVRTTACVFCGVVEREYRDLAPSLKVL